MQGKSLETTGATLGIVFARGEEPISKRRPLRF